MAWMDQTRLDAQIAALEAKHERLRALVFDLKLHDTLRREAVRQDSVRLRRDANCVLAHFDRCYAHFFGDEKANFNPDQLRVPAGNPDGGQWTGSGGQSAAMLRLAGEWPSNEPPDIPKERPPTAQERNKVAKQVARWLGKRAALAAAVFEAARWLNEYRADIVANLDSPKSLDALRESVATPKAGYDIHHIVEQTPAAQDGYPRHMIDAPENLVRIPRLKHREINGWYQKGNQDFDGLSPREYLRGKNWEERTRIGLDALIRYGVLKP